MRLLPHCALDDSTRATSQTEHGVRSLWIAAAFRAFENLLAGVALILTLAVKEAEPLGPVNPTGVLALHIVCLRLHRPHLEV